MSLKLTEDHAFVQFIFPHFYRRNEYMDIIFLKINQNIS